jgi:hypothetical protein
LIATVVVVGAIVVVVVAMVGIGAAVAATGELSPGHLVVKGEVKRSMNTVMRSLRSNLLP